MRPTLAFCIVAVLLITLGLASVTRGDEPAFIYQTSISGYYLGSGHDMVVDSEGNAYVIASYYEDEQHLDILILKLDPEGAVAWTLPIVGDPSEHDYANDITLDSEEEVWITGYTGSGSFPLVNALDDSLTGFVEAFIMKLDPEDGTILYSTYLGGDYVDRGRAITFNDAGEIYVVGYTGSTDFPTTPDAYQDHPSAPLYIYSDAFITKLSPEGDEILYSTYFGGFKEDEALYVGLDDEENIVISGQTTSDDFPLVNPVRSEPDRIFVSKLSVDGSTLLFSTYLGGDNFEDLGGMDMDSEGHVYLTGETRSVEFPATAGAFQEDFVGEYRGCEEYPSIIVNCFDAYIVKLATDGSGIVYGSYAGGTINDRGRKIVVDNSGYAYIVGGTGSPNFLGTGNSFASIFVAGLNADGSELAYALTKQSPAAGAGGGVAVDDARSIYFTGAVGIPYRIYVAKTTGVAVSGVVKEGTEASGHLHLGPSSPNPFAVSTRLRYSIPSNAGSPVRLTVHDARGRLVTILAEGLCGPGTYSVTWDGTDRTGRQVASGIYFYHLEWNGRSDTQRIVLLR